MTKTIFQNDLFETRQIKQNERKPFFVSRYSEQRFLPYIRLPIEYLVISAVVVLIIAVISFAVGVERGKSIAGARAFKRAEMNPPLDIPIVPEVFVREENTNVVLERDMGIDTPEKGQSGVEIDQIEVDAARQEEIVAEEPKSLYTIQLASYRDERFARDQVKLLNESGESAGYSKSGSWYQVFVKGYSSMEDAREAKSFFVREYPDCYIRRQR